MRLAALITVGVAAVCWTSARAQTAGELLNACELLESGMHVERDRVFLPPGADVARCWGFMEAVREYSALADKDGKTLLHSCPPEDGSTTLVLRLFVEYARAHPEKLNLPAAAVAFNAMADAFPCK